MPIANQTLPPPAFLLRDWQASDLPAFAALNADPEVMRHFVAPLAREQSDAMAQRIQDHLQAQGFGLWALEAQCMEPTPLSGFVGFVGLARVPFAIDAAMLPGAPAIRTEPMEIGWRLAQAAWGRGLATAAAREVLRRAFVNLNLPQVVSFTATSNLRSQAVMQRIGMQHCGHFENPRVPEGHTVRPHVLYAIDREAWLGLPANTPA